MEESQESIFNRIGDEIGIKDHTTRLCIVVAAGIVVAFLGAIVLAGMIICVRKMTRCDVKRKKTRPNSSRHYMRLDLGDGEETTDESTLPIGTKLEVRSLIEQIQIDPDEAGPVNSPSSPSRRITSRPSSRTALAKGYPSTTKLDQGIQTEELATEEGDTSRVDSVWKELQMPHNKVPPSQPHHHHHHHPQIGEHHDCTLSCSGSSGETTPTQEMPPAMKQYMDLMDRNLLV